MAERLKSIYISENLIAQLIKHSDSDIPKDIKIRGCYYDPLKRKFDLIVYSKDWPLIPDDFMLERIVLEE